MKRLLIPFLSDNKAVSYTISALIITVTTISLVIVSFVYAYQVLERQMGASEFEVYKKSMLAFNDALENIAWKQGSARSFPFRVKYGQLELIPGAGTRGETELKIKAEIEEGNGEPEIIQTYSNGNATGFLRYRIETHYVTFGQGYQAYLLGDENLLLVGSTESYGRAIIEQKYGWVSITLDYNRVRVLKSSVITSEGALNYIDFYVIQLKMMKNYIIEQVGEFDLKARTLSVKMNTSQLFDLTDSDGNGFADQTIEVEVEFESDIAGEEIEIEQEIEISQLVTANGSGKVVFNFITAEMLVSA